QPSAKPIAIPMTAEIRNETTSSIAVDSSADHTSELRRSFSAATNTVDARGRNTVLTRPILAMISHRQKRASTAMVRSALAGHLSLPLDGGSPRTCLRDSRTVSVDALT